MLGSFIRPARLIEARRAFMDGRISRVELGEIEDQSVHEVVAMQENVGLRSITDGEFRQGKLPEGFSGFDRRGTCSSRRVTDLLYHDDQGNTEPGNKAVMQRKNSMEEVAQRRGVPISQINYEADAKSHYPGTQHRFICSQVRTALARSVYPDLDGFWADLVEAYAAELRALGDAGCTYVQLDETCLPKLADPAIQEVVRRRGDDGRMLDGEYAEVINRIIEKKPDTIRMVMHHCRGNRGNFWQARASYDAVAEVMFSANLRGWLFA